MNRTEFQNKGRKILQDVGMKVTLTGSRKKAPAGMIGFPDMIAFGENFTALIEVKFGTDTMKPKQIQFKGEIEPLTGKHLMYIVASHIVDFREVARQYEQSKR